MSHITSNLLLYRFRQMSLPRTRSDPQPSDKTDVEDGCYRPTPIDIIVARIMLSRSLKLPSELVDSILDMAEYWAHSVNVIDYQANQHNSLLIQGGSRVEDKFLLRSYPVGLTGIDEQDSLSKALAYDTRCAKPLPRKIDRDPSYFSRLVKYPTPRLLNPVRKIVFKIKSHDQGWGGDIRKKGTYHASWTWFEAGLERFDAEATCTAQCALDVRQDETDETDETEAKDPALPVCALRPLHPKIAKKQNSSQNSNGNALNQVDDDGRDDAENEYAYVQGLYRSREWQIQCNRTAAMAWQEHTVTWSYLDDVKPDSDAGKEMSDQGRGRATGDGAFVRNLRMGDVVTIWGKARFRGWVNYVEHVKIEVYWAV